MARKVFISFLGTSIYNECEYTKDDFASKSIFIQEATIRYLTSMETWGARDSILILLTDRAEKLNWVDNGQIDPKTKKCISSIGLENTLKGMNKTIRIDTIKHLPEGKDEKEILIVFERIYNYLQEGDSLYFDFTHAFRYMPMLVLVLGNYAKFLKNVSIKSITYGNYEMSEKGTKPAPIIDLISLSQLQDWTFAAGQFIESGNANQIVSLSKKEYSPILAETRGSDALAKSLKAFSDSMARVVSERQSCRCLDIYSGQSIELIDKAFHSLSFSQATPFMPLFEKIVDTWSGFSKSYDPLNGIKAAQWCYDKGLFLQAATCLEETVLYIFSLKFGLHPISQDGQTILSGAFDYAASFLAGTTSKKKYTDTQLKIGHSLLTDYEDIIQSFQILRQNIRNDFNHAGIRKNPWKAKVIIESLKTQLESISSALLEQNTGNSKNLPSDSLFLNLSNHPSKEWSSSQITEAERYGKIEDIPFPDVSPTLTSEEINFLSEEIVNKIISKAPHYSAVVHIMGEMTLTYTVVSQLKALGYKCLASTTERDVSMDSEGNKTVHFEFRQFREY